MMKALYTERGKTGIFLSQKPGGVVFRVCIAKDRPLGYAMKGLRTKYGQRVEPDEASTSSRSHSLRWLMLCHLKRKKLGAGSPMFIVCIFLFPRRGETST
jgi:hypothetical protein